jgi:hypothetical protein
VRSARRARSSARVATTSTRASARRRGGSSRHTCRRTTRSSCGRSPRRRVRTWSSGTRSSSSDGRPRRGHGPDLP